MNSRSVFVLLLTIMLACSAHAAEIACTDQNASACAEEGAAHAKTQNTLRISLDNAKADIADKLSGLQLSAFADVRSAYDDAGNHKLERGSVELNASGDFSHDLQGALAVVNSAEDTRVTVAVLDYHTFGGRIAPRGRLWVEKGFHLQLGRFDVPFGNDWQFFPSKDSVSISRPLTTDLIMEGGYNDEGIRMLGNNGSANFNLFLLRGFNAGRLLGGRLGITPFSDPFSLKGAKEPKTFEFGLSCFYDGDMGWAKNETAFAADAEIRLGAWATKMEYLRRKKEAVLSEDSSVISGWHFTQEYAFAEAIAWPTTVFARYEQVSAHPAEIAAPGANAGDERDVRVAAGFSSNLGNGNVVLWKFEIQHYISATPSTRELPGFGRGLFWFTQLVLVL